MTKYGTYRIFKCEHCNKIVRVPVTDDTSKELEKTANSNKKCKLVELNSEPEETV